MSQGDQEVLGRIHELVAEEKDLRARHIGDGLDDDAKARLHQVEESLDQCWDLLRQRRAKEEFGDDPDSAKVRPASTVESYLE